MVIKFTVSKSGFTEDFIWKIWEAQNDTIGGIIQTGNLVEKNAGGVPTPGAGHQISEEVTVNGLDKIVHIVRIYGVVSGIEYTEFNIEPESPMLTVYLPIYFKIGDGNPDTPAADQNIATTPELAGLVVGNFTIFRTNFGPLQPDNQFEFTNPGAGEWTLIQDGDQFNDGEEFTILRQPVVSVAVNDSVVGKMFGGFYDITSNINYSLTHLRKLGRFQGAFEYTFDVDPPIGYQHAFNHYGSAGTGKVIFSNAPLLWNGIPVTELEVPQFSQLCVSFDGSDWNIVWFVISVGTTVPQPSDILGSGVINIGNLPTGDPVYIVTHSLGISGDYNVWLEIKSNNPAFYSRDNEITKAWWHSVTDKPNKFEFSLKALRTETENISVNYLIIKA